MKKSYKKILIVLVFIILAVLVGKDNLLYILNGENAEQIVYRASQVIMSNDFSNTETKESEKEEYILEVSGDLKVYFFDVGQSDCILISNNNENMIIDGGNNPDGKLIVNELQKMGIEEGDIVRILDYEFEYTISN